jgi:hypothetical protein
MTRWLLVLIAAATLGACGDDSPTAPTNLPLVFSAALIPAEEVPPVTNAEAGGRGAMQVRFERATTGGDATATIYFQLSGFPRGTSLVGAHIHSASFGVNGPIVVNTGIAAASGVVADDGTLEFTARGISVPAATLDAIVDDPGGFYFNVHSPANPGGFSRGQLRRVQ